MLGEGQQVETRSNLLLGLTPPSQGVGADRLTSGLGQTPAFDLIRLFCSPGYRQGPLMGVPASLRTPRRSRVSGKRGIKQLGFLYFSGADHLRSPQWD